MCKTVGSESAGKEKRINKVQYEIGMNYMYV